MNLPQTAAEVLRQHVTLECECIDRMYLNVYVPQLQSVGGVVGYLHAHHGQRFASTAAVAPMSEAFVEEVERFAAEQGVDVVPFRKGQRKDEVTQQYLAEFEGTEGVLYIGKAQERARVVRTEPRRNARTETTINDTPDFALGRRLHNLAALRQVGFTANRRLLDVQTISHDCALGEADLQRHQRPVEVNGQRGSALRFADGRVQALLQALLAFVLLPRGFSSAELRAQLAPLLGLDPSQLTSGRLSYDLRRLRLHGLIERLPGTHRYQLTEAGVRTAMFYTRVYQRILRPGLSLLSPQASGEPATLQRRFSAMNDAIHTWCEKAKLAA